MPQMGDLLQGFLYRKQEYEQEELAEEQKKRQKLEDQLRELNFTELQRDLERDAKEWEKQQDLWKAFGELSPEEQKQVQFPGIKEEEEAELPYPWMGTPYEEAGARKEFYIKPEEIVQKKETTPKRMTSAQYRTQASSLEKREGTAEEVARFSAEAERLRQEADKLFRQEQQIAGMIPDISFTPGGRTPAEGDLESLLGDFRPEAGGYPEEDAYIQQVKPYMSDYDIDWDVIAKKHPNWDIEYIKTKLGQ